MFGNKRSGPGGHGIQRFPGQQEIADQDGEEGGGGQIRSAPRQVGQVPVKQAGQIKTIKEVANEGSSVHLKDFQAGSVGQSRQGKRWHGSLMASRANARWLP